MRIIVLVALIVALAACEQPRESEAPRSRAGFMQPPLRPEAGAPATPTLCVENPMEALHRRLRIDGIVVADPVAGPMSPRMANAQIPAHSERSLFDGLARYAPNVAVLITYADADESCSWLVARAGIVGYGRTNVGLAQIRQDVARVFAALNVNGAMAMRAPQQNNWSEATSAPALPLLPTGELATALAHVGETVTPGAVASALQSFDSFIVVPHEGIAAFPMMLLTEGRASGEPRYVIDRVNRSIEVAPSIAEIGIGPGIHRNAEVELASMTREARQLELSNALIVGDPHYATFVQLSGAYDEAKAVAGTLGATPLLREAATNAAVRERLRARPRYVHFATHGVADLGSAVDNQSFLALAGTDRLTISDVRSVGGFANGSIVVLSACQTALGASRPGGLVGLPRAFLNHGAQTVVMSMWNVNDGATNFMMQRFALHLQTTGRPSSAFAQAVRDTRADVRFADPRLWGSFEVFGVGQP